MHTIVGNTNTLDLSLLLELLQSFPALKTQLLSGCRTVDQVEVYVVETKLLQAGLESSNGLFGTV